MMYKFNTNEIEIIVRAILESRKEEEYFQNDEGYFFPESIDCKLRDLSEEEYTEFITTCENIADDVEESLSGELNTLHRMHDEIRIILENYN